MGFTGADRQVGGTTLPGDSELKDQLGWRSSLRERIHGVGLSGGRNHGV